MKNIYKLKIEFHYSFLIIALGFILTGYFLNLIIFTSIILIHELGHYIMAIKCHIKVQKIVIYPYGGLTKLNHKINININKELLVAISGIIVQSVYFIMVSILYKKGLLRLYTYNLFQKYHYTILYFNILPIIPLDGFKILNLLLSKIINYKKANIISVYISIITILLLIILFKNKINYTYILILSILINNIYDFLFNLKYLYNRFLLERYLYNIRYNKIKIINNKEKFFKNCSHIIKINKKYIKEQELLSKIFDLTKKI